jgi:thiol-disulfide isomerase/thioredoxin
MKSLFVAVIIAFAFSLGVAQNEQAPLVEKDITYKNWKYKSVSSGEEIDLRKLSAGKKLVMVIYYAPWCGNWKYDLRFLPKLYEKYRSAGLEIVGVGEYDPVAMMKDNQQQFKIPFPLVYESENRDQREKTLHAEYRKITGDTRKWGSPWYIFIDPATMEKKGDVLLTRTHVINGEMIETEGEAFIRQKLGLSAVDAKASIAKTDTVEVCDPNEKKTTELKKP